MNKYCVVYPDYWVSNKLAELYPGIYTGEYERDTVTVTAGNKSQAKVLGISKFRFQRLPWIINQDRLNHNPFKGVKIYNA